MTKALWIAGMTVADAALSGCVETTGGGTPA